MEREDIRRYAEMDVRVMFGGISAANLYALIQKHEELSEPYAFGDNGGEFQDGALTGLEYALEMFGYNVVSRRMEEG